MLRVSKRHHDRAYRKLRPIVLAEADGLCQIRGPTCTVIATTVDHVVPLDQGGTHDRWNLRAACVKCNGRGAAAITNAKRAERKLGRRSRQW
jgi:5-methylcytosine-specific restriction endonuclease McrA